MKPGTFTQTPYYKKHNTKENQLLGPGKYEIDTGGFNPKSISARASGPGWEQAHNAARLAMMPHLLYKEEFEHKKMLETDMAPGKYEIKDSLQPLSEKPRSTLGIISTKEKRFRPVIKSEETPGPGNYGENGIPNTGLERSNKKSASNRGLMECGKSVLRSLPIVGSHLGPGSYKIGSFTEDILNKTTSLRGPYDLFSDDRNNPIKYGYLRNSASSKLGPGEYEIKSFVDDLTGVTKKRSGQFGKLTQHPSNASERMYASTLSQCPRNESEPGPGMYEKKDGINLSSFAKASPGFLSSSIRDDLVAKKFFLSNNNSVGVGRHFITKQMDNQHINGHRSIFKSKTSKMDVNDERYFLERLKPRSVGPMNEINLIPKKGCNSNANHSLSGMQRALTVA